MNDNTILSYGELSEKAAESWNKWVKLFRHDNSGKHSREMTNMFILNLLLLNVDPVVFSIRKLPCKKYVLVKQPLEVYYFIMYLIHITIFRNVDIVNYVLPLCK